MSTNAVIRIEGFRLVELYKHNDGYPEATLPWLEKFNLNFVKIRGNDMPYKFAQLVRSSSYMAKEFPDLDKSEFTGWGVSPQGENSYEYLYLLKKDGSVDYVKNGV